MLDNESPRRAAVFCERVMLKKDTSRVSVNGQILCPTLCVGLLKENLRHPLLCIRGTTGALDRHLGKAHRRTRVRRLLPKHIPTRGSYSSMMRRNGLPNNWSQCNAFFSTSTKVLSKTTQKNSY
ncbi:hypothetical protein KM043_013182 [Ampulex compressa]|nr:hypothetical protein KM043_013182 [Ampulex compressa]